jgi:haloacid dehalogenase-like hydrolase
MRRHSTERAHPRWNRLYTELVYQPMLEVMQYLRENGYKVHIVTGGGQAFVRVYADKVYGAQPEEVIGSSLATQFEYNASGKAVLIRPPKLLLYDDSSGKPQDIYLFLGRPPRAEFGNSTGDQQMLEYTQSGGGARLMALVMHDDEKREYANGPGSAQTDTKFGAFTQALYDEAKAKGWVVISMKDDWKRLFPFEGAYRIALGEVDRAREAAREALRWARQAQDALLIAIALQHFSLLLALRGEVNDAARLIGYVNVQFKELGYAREATEKWGYEKLMAEGAAWSEDQAVEEALKV